MDQKLQRICVLIEQQLERKNHPLVARLLQMSKPQRLPTDLLSAMVIHDYPIDQVMARFTSVDCEQALHAAVENHKPNSVELLLDFISDSVNLVPLARRALEKNDLPILEIISQSLSQNDKLLLLSHFCMRQSWDDTNVPPPHRAAEILLEDTPSSELLNFANTTTTGPTSTTVFQKVCEELLILRQRRVLEQAAEDNRGIASKRKM